MYKSQFARLSGREKAKVIIRAKAQVMGQPGWQRPTTKQVVRWLTNRTQAADCAVLELLHGIGYETAKHMLCTEGGVEIRRYKCESWNPYGDYGGLHGKTFVWEEGIYLLPDGTEKTIVSGERNPRSDHDGVLRTPIMPIRAGD